MNNHFSSVKTDCLNGEYIAGTLVVQPAQTKGYCSPQQDKTLAGGTNL